MNPTCETQNARRLMLLRRVHGKSKCNHLDVLIRAIIKPFSTRTHSRTIGGRCQVCGRDVEREVTALEISGGVAQTAWRAP